MSFYLHEDGLAQREREQLLRATLEVECEDLHDGVAWIWDGERLRCKNSRNMERDEVCHYNLFGDICYVAPCRGWYIPEKRRLSISVNGRYGPSGFTSLELMPEQLYKALINRFGNKIRMLLI